MKVRREQFNAFQSIAEDNFVSDLMELLSRNFGKVVINLIEEPLPIDKLSQEKLEYITRIGIGKARQYGIKERSSLTAFVSLMIVFAPNFDKHQTIQSILASNEIEPEQKLNELTKRTSDEDWAEVRNNYDPMAWELKLKGVN